MTDQYDESDRCTSNSWYYNMKAVTPPDARPYYKVTYEIKEAEHGGYCSDYDSGDEDIVDWRKTTHVGYLDKKSWNFDTKPFKINSGCVDCTEGIGSGYCGLRATVTLKSITTIS